MKILSLAWSGIVSFAKRKLYFLLIIFLSLAVSMVGILFFFSAAVSRYESNQSTYQETRTLKLELKEAEPNQIFSLLDKLQDKKLPGVLRLFLADHDIQAEKMHKGPNTWEEFTLIGEYDADTSNIFGRPGYLAKGKYFSGIQDDRDVCVIDMSTRIPGTNGSYKWQLGMDIPTKHGQYKLIGMREHEMIVCTAALPIGAYVRAGFTTRVITCVYDRALTKGEIKHLQTLVEDDMVTAATLPSRVEGQALQDIAIEMTLYLVAFLLCLVNLIVMVQYWVASNLKTYQIYAICGGSKGRVIRVQLTSCMLLAVGACALGAGVYAAVLRNRLFTLPPAQEAVSWAVSVGTVLLVTFILSLIATVWFLRKRDLYAVEGVGR